MTDTTTIMNKQPPIVPTRRFSKPQKRRPGLAMVATLASGKGGPGKSTIAREVAYWLAALGYAVLLNEVEYNCRQLATLAGLSTYAGQTVDNNSTTWALFTNPALAEGIEPIQIDVPALVAQLGVPQRQTWGMLQPQVLEYIPGSKSLRSLDNRVTFAERSHGTGARDDLPETRYRHGVDALRPYYDVIIQDTPPVTGLVQRNAITASDSIIIVADFDIDTIEDVALTLEFMYDSIAFLGARNERQPQLLGVVYNKYDASEEIDRDLLHRYRNAHFTHDDDDELHGPLITLPELGVLRFDKSTPKRADRARVPMAVYAPASGLVSDYARLSSTLLAALGLAK